MRRLLLVIVVLAAGFSAQAANLFVYPSGAGTYPNIQAAVDGANTGDIIYLMPGTFTGPGNRDILVTSTITLRSNNIDNPAIIDCQGSAAEPHRGFNIGSGDPTLDHLIIRNGYAPYGGAINADGGSTYLEYCQFENNTATIHGGAVSADAFQPA